ncbi:serine hydrolase domain-containing protein [Arthrobacter castelli]|uniref:serine hydrolase domain-containing protein n=1 Tax=Arthrobacter castelli TaxID=271431 RepID=UPI0006853B24|nr:serine hydrolase domain-containing protein [Arthrobacter castelli]
MSDMHNDEPRAWRSAIRDVLTEAVADGLTPSAVCAVARDGRRIEPVVVGDAVRYGPDGVELAPAARVPASPATVYDIASITKVFTAVTILTLVRDGVLGLDEPVFGRLAAFSAGAKRAITVRQLLTHTSGLPAEWEDVPGGQPFDRSELLERLAGLELEADPGSRFIYSCVGYNVLMHLAEQLTGTEWSHLVHDRLLTPLERDDPASAALTYFPDPGACAATEYQPDRGMVRGAVHDETAWTLGGAAGNAGLFSTASALLSVGEWLRTGMGGLLPAQLQDELWRDQLPHVLDPQASRPDYGQGLGLRIGHLAWVGRSGGEARGHGGFTGTSLLVDRTRRLSVVLLTNRVHPFRDTDVQPVHAAVAELAGSG